MTNKLKSKIKLPPIQKLYSEPTRYEKTAALKELNTSLLQIKCFQWRYLV